MPENPYEQNARLVKAYTLADALCGVAGWDSAIALDTSRRLTSKGWRELAGVAGVRPPSPATVAVVQGILAERSNGVTTLRGLA
jgi:hypothetical protein